MKTNTTLSIDSGLLTDFDIHIMKKKIESYNNFQGKGDLTYSQTNWTRSGYIAYLIRKDIEQSSSE